MGYGVPWENIQADIYIYKYIYKYCIYIYIHTYIYIYYAYYDKKLLLMSC